MAIGNGSFAKNTRDGGFVYGDDQGMEYITGAAAPGTSLISFRLTSAGSPDTVVFADLGLSDMADDQYNVFVQGETAARVTVDQSTITPQGFDVLGGAGAEVLHLMVVGAVAGQSQA